MKNLTLVLLISFVCLSSFLYSVEKKSSEEEGVTLEKVDKKIDKIYETQQFIYEETKNNPLHDKKYGIEANFFRLLLLKNTSFSGTFSLFDINRDAELAFPIYYFKPEEEFFTEIFTLDCHYRYFLRNTQNGFYISAFARYAKFDGWVDNWDNEYSDKGDYYKKKTISDIGIGVGVGYRIFSYKGLYWGTSVSFGRYIGGNKIEELEFDNNDLFIPIDQIVNIEFLKFGWAF
ncbi:hypothetical protein JEZ13_07295 [bacterium]|nr:hypothetical protein [bacterium]